MTIAVTYENGQIFQHFGHTQQFKLYDVEDGKIISSKIIDTNGSRTWRSCRDCWLLEHRRTYLRRYRRRCTVRPCRSGHSTVWRRQW